MGNRNQLLSWVLDFHHLSEGSRCKHRRYSLPRLSQFDWSGERLRISFPLAEGPGRLSTMGQIFGEVMSGLPSSGCPRERLYGDVTGALFDEAVFSKLLEWLHKCSQFIEYQPEELSSMRMVLCCNDPYDDASEGMQLSTFMGLSATQHYPHFNRESVYHCLQPFLTYDPHPRYDSGRNLCHIRIGKIVTFAWVPELAQPGDFLTAFIGAPYAFVLRQDRPKRPYRLLGDPYISGLPGSLVVTQHNFSAWIKHQANKSRGLHADYISDFDVVDDTWRWIQLI